MPRLNESRERKGLVSIAFDSVHGNDCVLHSEYPVKNGGSDITYSPEDWKRERHISPSSSRRGWGQDI